MALTAQEKERTRYHLGYGNVEPSASISFGVPAPVQTLFLLEEAMNRMLPEGEDRIRRYLKILDDIECKLVDAQDRLAAKSLGELVLERDHGNEPDLLEREYARWGMRLAEHLRVPIYPYAERYKQFAASMAGSIPVRG